MQFTASFSTRLHDYKTKNCIILGSVIVILCGQQCFHSVFVYNIASGNCFWQQCFPVYDMMFL